MPASNDRIRRHMKVERTRNDAGWKTTIEVVAYDNGMVSVNGDPSTTRTRTRTRARTAGSVPPRWPC
jgi:hypothetical protein